MYTSVVPYGNSLLIRERDAKGRLKAWREREFQPSVYIHSEKGSFTNLRGDQKLARVETGDIAATKDFMESYVENSNVSIYGMDNIALQYIQAMYDRKQPIPKSAIRTGTLDIEVGSDQGFPDPMEAKYPVTAITYFDSFDNIFHVWSTCAWESSKSELKPDVLHRVKYTQCDTEEDILRGFMEYWTSNYPDIITGWNTDGFDLIYLYNRMVGIWDETEANTMSPWNVVRTKKFTKFNKDQHEVNLLGINQLDYLKLYRKHTFKMQESYSLDHIASIELKGHRKLSYEEVGSLHELYKTNPQKYVDYNITDVDLVLRIDFKKKLLALVIDVAYFAGVNYDDTFSPVKIWEAKIYDYLMSNGIIVPWKSNQGDNDSGGELLGAFVKEAPTGKIWKWVMSFDLTSLYPSIMRQWNLGPDTLTLPRNYELQQIHNLNIVNKILKMELTEGQLEALRMENLCLAGNGTFYTNSKKSFMNVLMEELFTERKRCKDLSIAAKKAKTHLEEGSDEWKKQDAIVSENFVREQALKVLLNSAYGALGNAYFMFYDLDVAGAVTYSGQAITQWIEIRLNKYLNDLFKTQNVDYILYIDTDSVYINCEQFVKRFIPKGTPENDIVDFLDKVGQKFRDDVIDPGYEHLQKHLNCMEQLMIMKREAIASAAFWKAKKKYAMRVLDSEGVREEDYKIMGLEAISTKTPIFSRKALKEAYKIILTKENEALLDFIDEFRTKVDGLSIEDLALGTSVSGLKKYSDDEGYPIQGTPQHVAAALLYNRLIKQYGVDGTYESIKEGEKMKMVYLKQRNPLKTFTVVGFSSFWPRQFELDKFIDRNRMFERGFLSPLAEMCDTFNWQTERVADLTQFFT
jgi:DNA polymerase elongation subunit (family B)